MTCPRLHSNGGGQSRQVYSNLSGTKGPTLSFLKEPFSSLTSWASRSCRRGSTARP